MLFYHFNLLDNFIKNDLIDNLKAERNSIKEIANLYTNKKINVLSITTNIIELGDSIDKNKSEKFYEIVSLLREWIEKLVSIQELISILEKNLIETISLYDKSLENNFDEIKANLVEYNKQRDELSHKILEFETLNTTVLNSSIALSLDVSHKNKKKKKKLISIPDTIENQETTRIVDFESCDNNTLVVSEKEQKAYLPFFYSKIKEIYENSNYIYETLQDVVDNLYVIPLGKFKNSAISRFRETFYLVKNKEKASISKAIDLGLELMFKYELNPIVIAACRNLDELDIYLDCLEDNQVHEFPCFEIKFEVMPQLKANLKIKK